MTGVHCPPPRFYASFHYYFQHIFCHNCQCHFCLISYCELAIGIELDTVCCSSAVASDKPGIRFHLVLLINNVLRYTVEAKSYHLGIDRPRSSTSVSVSQWQHHANCIFIVRYLQQCSRVLCVVFVCCSSLCGWYVFIMYSSNALP